MAPAGEKKADSQGELRICSRKGERRVNTVEKRRKSPHCLVGAIAAAFCFCLTVFGTAQEVAAPPAQHAAAAAPAQSSKATPAEEWKTYTYPEDGFSALFPVAPQQTRRDLPTSAGSIELRSYIAEMEPVALFVGVCDYGAAAQSRDPDTMLQGAKKGALDNSKSHLVREKPITLGIYKGLEFEAESDSAHFYARIYLVGTILYQTLAVYPINNPYDGTRRFLDSFQLIARVRNPG